MVALCLWAGSMSHADAQTPQNNNTPASFVDADITRCFAVRVTSHAGFVQTSAHKVYTFRYDQLRRTHILPVTRRHLANTRADKHCREFRKTIKSISVVMVPEQPVLQTPGAESEVVHTWLPWWSIEGRGAARASNKDEGIAHVLTRLGNLDLAEYINNESPDAGVAMQLMASLKVVLNDGNELGGDKGVGSEMISAFIDPEWHPLQFSVVTSPARYLAIGGTCADFSSGRTPTAGAIDADLASSCGANPFGTRFFDTVAASPVALSFRYNPAVRHRWFGVGAQLSAISLGASGLFTAKDPDPQLLVVPVDLQVGLDFQVPDPIRINVHVGGGLAVTKWGDRYAARPVWGVSVTTPLHNIRNTRLGAVRNNVRLTSRATSNVALSMLDLQAAKNSTRSDALSRFEDDLEALRTAWDASGPLNAQLAAAETSTLLELKADLEKEAKENNTAVSSAQSSSEAASMEAQTITDKVRGKDSVRLRSMNDRLAAELESTKQTSDKYTRAIVLLEALDNLVDACTTPNEEPVTTWCAAPRDMSDLNALEDGLDAWKKVCGTGQPTGTGPIPVTPPNTDCTY